MSESVSIAFEDMWEHESPAIFSRDGGKEFVERVIEFCQRLMPLEKELPSNEIILYFWWWYVEKYGYIQNNSGYYMGADRTDGDNSGHGHYVVSIVTGQVVRNIDAL